MYQGSVLCIDPCISGKMLASAMGICVRKSTSRYHARCCVRVQLKFLFNLWDLIFLYCSFKFVWNSDAILIIFLISVWVLMWYMIQFACHILLEYLPCFWIRRIWALADSMQAARATLQTLNMRMVNIIMNMLLTNLMVDAKQFIMMVVVACQRKHRWLILHMLSGILKLSTIFSP